MSEPIRRISPEQAVELLAEGCVYLDVRSEPEFEQGHVPGAMNVPLLHARAGEMIPNEEFLSVVKRIFPLDQRLVVGCRSGVRSLRAAELLSSAGYDQLWELRTGWEGCRGTFGQFEAGWVRQGLPVEQGQPDGRDYASLSARPPASG